MAEEVELQEELNKLEITPILPQVKMLDINLPVQLNPFFENDKDTDPNVKSQHTTDSTNTVNRTQSIISRPAANCRRCRYRRASESILDEIKYNRAPTDSSECSRTPPSGILKHSLKKTAISVGGPGSRKVLLREPVLKAIQTCFHSQSSARKNLPLSSDPNVTSAEKNNGPLTTKGMSDFRNLIEECRNLLSEEVDFTGRLNQLCLSSRNSKNFTTMQTPKIPTGNSNKLRSNRKQILNAISPTKSSLSSISLEEYQHLHNNGMSLIQPSLLSHNISSTSSLQQRNINNLSPEHSRCGTTCSQQAGNSATASSSSDDVTIDELASYFDTFVHIPKKMSSMAEMMYI